MSDPTLCERLRGKEMENAGAGRIGREAADELEARAAEIVQLREALLFTSDVCHSGSEDVLARVAEARKVALAALAAGRPA